MLDSFSNKLRVCMLLFILVTISIILLFVFIPISSTYLVDDVMLSNYSSDSKVGMYYITKDEFIGNIASNEDNYVSSSRQALVKVAMKEVGTKEIGGNTNNIKYNDWYQPAHTWLTGRDEYCAIFTLWCFNEIGMFKLNSKSGPTIDSAACTTLACEYKKNNRFMEANSGYLPMEGDLVLFTKWVPQNNEVGYKSNHIGIVVDVDENYIYTVEGNTSIPAGDFQDAGNGVYTKKHVLPKNGNKSNILGYAIPWYEGEY